MTKHDVHRAIIELVGKGYTQQKIAQKLGMTQSAVSQMMKRMVVRGQLEHECKVRDPRFVQKIVELHGQGLTCAQISLEVGRNMSVIYAVLRELINAGAIEGRGRGRPMSPDHEELMNRVEDMTKLGYTVTEIAADIGRSFSTVVNMRATLRHAGRIPPKANANHGIRIDWTPIRPKIIRMIEAGHSAQGMAFALGVSCEALKKFLKSEGIQTNRQKKLARYRLGRSI